MKTIPELQTELVRLNDQLDERLAEMQAIHERADGELTGGQKQRWENLQRGVTSIKAQIAETDGELRSALLERGQAHGQPGDAGARDAGYHQARRTTEDLPPGLVTVRDAAYRNIEESSRAGHLPDHAAQKATNLLEQGSTVDRGIAARWAAAAGAAEYRTGFAKLLADPERGHLLWTPEEAAAYRTAAAVNSEMRAAMSTTGANGGYMIPLTLDPAIMLTNDGSNNPLRRLARIEQTVTNTWQGVTSAGATSEWKTEGSEVADGSPTVGNPSIPLFFGDSFVPYSFEVGMDAVNFLDQLARVLVDSADNLMAVAYTTGDGSSAPQGIVTGLAGTSSEINTTGTEALDASDPYALQNALPARFSANATFMSHIATANTYRQMETTNGAHEFPELRQSPPMLLGKPWNENSNMDGAINAAATASNYALLYGDVRAGFIIVDRVGSTLELIPNLMGANGRPTGERGALLWFRTGSEVVVPQALRLLDVPTTA